MVRRLSRLVVIVTAMLGLAVVLFGAFLAWRIPNEREEERLFTAHVHRDDGPHVTWLDDRTVRILELLFRPRPPGVRSARPHVALRDGGPGDSGRRSQRVGRVLISAHRACG